MTTDASHTWPQLTAALLRREQLSSAEAAWAMHEIMSGDAEPLQVGGFLIALEAKGVTSEELAALADAMISHARPVQAPREAVDIVGTGGDMAQTVNISTMAAMVIASTGRTVVKHGNRASTSKSGSADVLEALGIRLDLPPQTVSSLVESVGMAFLFAQVYHPSMRHTVPTRKGLAVPTVFNILGPITNPAHPQASAVGVAKLPLAPTVAGVFAQRHTSALVFRGQDGLDEITVQAPTDVWEVRGGTVRTHVIDPEEMFAIPRSPVGALQGGDASHNARVVLDLFDGQRTARLDAIRAAVLLNAAAGIVAYDGIGADAADGFDQRFRSAYEEAATHLAEGQPRQLVQRWATHSQHLAGGQ